MSHFRLLTSAFLYHGIVFADFVIVRYQCAFRRCRRVVRFDLKSGGGFQVRLTFISFGNVCRREVE